MRSDCSLSSPSSAPSPSSAHLAVAQRACRGLFLLALIFLCSCVAPQYDSQADTSISAVQKEIHLQIDQWISYAKAGDSDSLKKASYAANVGFYDKVDTDLKSLELRMEATPDPSTSNLPTFFNNLNAQLANLRNTHMHIPRGYLSEYALRPIQNQMDAQFAVLLTYELSLKTGPGGTTKSTATSQNPTSQN